MDDPKDPLLMTFFSPMQKMGIGCFNLLRWGKIFSSKHFQTTKPLWGFLCCCFLQRVSIFYTQSADLVAHSLCLTRCMVVLLVSKKGCTPDMAGAWGHWTWVCKVPRGTAEMLPCHAHCLLKKQSLPDSNFNSSHTKKLPSSDLTWRRRKGEVGKMWEEEA